MSLSFALFFWATYSLVSPPALAQEVQPIPALTARVIDSTQTLNPAQKSALEQKLVSLEQQYGSQVVVLMLPSSTPEDIASYAQRVASSWKIGRKDVGDGLLIVVALNDRRVRLEVSKALEGALPDLAAKHIINQALAPAFKQGQYAQGLSAAADALGQRLAAEQGKGWLPAPSAQPSGSGGQSGGFEFLDLAIFGLVAVPILASVLMGMFGKPLGVLGTGGAAGFMGWYLTSVVGIAAGAGVLGLLVALFVALRSRHSFSHQTGRHSRTRRSDDFFSIPSGGHNGGFGGGLGGGDGGFGSGGGGDFGGGGASGDW